MIQSTSPGETRTEPGRLIYRGAEADLFSGDWEGLKAVYKVRKAFPYRIPELDGAIRRQRTIREAEMVGASKEAGVSSPHLYFVDPASCTLVMEFIEGDRLRDVVAGLTPDGLGKVFRGLGRDVAKLHRSGIMHGDLTTANVIWRDGRPVFLDFGLSLRSTRVEDHAVDLRLIKETLSGAHSGAAPAALSHLLEGYGGELGQARTSLVLRQLSSIERRGRYARVT